MIERDKKGKFLNGHNVSKEMRKKISERTKKAMKNPEVIKKIVDANIGRTPWNKDLTKDTDERVKRITEKMIGENGYWFGKKMSKETREKMSESQKRIIASGKKKIWNKSLKNWMTKEHKMKLYLTHKGKKRSKETKEKIGLANSKALKGKHCSPRTEFTSESVKQLWQDPIYRNKIITSSKKMWNDLEYIKKIQKSMHIKPNIPEKKLIKIFSKNNLPYKFVGDYSFIVNGLNPDFINCNGQKKIIEMFGTYWHNNPKTKYHQTEKGRKKHYKLFGFETLIIWENELKDELKLLEKINNFENEVVF